MTTAQRPAKPSTHRASGGRDIFSRMLQMEKQSTQQRSLPKSSTMIAPEVAISSNVSIGRNSTSQKTLVPDMAGVSVPYSTKRPSSTPRTQTLPAMLKAKENPPNEKIRVPLTINTDTKDDGSGASEICLSPSWSDHGEKKRKKDKKRNEKDQKEAEKRRRQEEQRAVDVKAGKRLSKKPPPPAMETQKNVSNMRRNSMTASPQSSSPQETSRRSSREGKRLSIGSFIAERRSQSRQRSQSKESTRSRSASCADERPGTAESSEPRKSAVSQIAPRLPSFRWHSRKISPGTNKTVTWGASDEGYETELIGFAYQLDASVIATEPEDLRLKESIPLDGSADPERKKQSGAPKFVRSATEPNLMSVAQNGLPTKAPPKSALSQPNSPESGLLNGTYIPIGKPYPKITQPAPVHNEMSGEVINIALEERARSEKDPAPPRNPPSTSSQTRPPNNGGSYVFKQRMHQQESAFAGFEDEQAVKLATERALEEEAQQEEQKRLELLSSERNGSGQLDAIDKDTTILLPDRIRDSSKPRAPPVQTSNDHPPQFNNARKYQQQNAKSPLQNNGITEAGRTGESSISEDTQPSVTLSKTQTLPPSKTDKILGFRRRSRGNPLDIAVPDAHNHQGVERQSVSIDSPESNAKRSKLGRMSAQFPLRVRRDSLNPELLLSKDSIESRDASRGHSRTRTSSSQLLINNVSSPTVKATEKNPTEFVKETIKEEGKPAPEVISNGVSRPDSSRSKVGPHEKVTKKEEGKPASEVISNGVSEPDSSRGKVGPHEKVTKTANEKVEPIKAIKPDIPKSKDDACPKPSKTENALVVESSNDEGLIRKASITRPRSNPQLQTQNTGANSLPSLDFLPQLKHQPLVKSKRQSPPRPVIDSVVPQPLANISTAYKSPNSPSNPPDLSLMPRSPLRPSPPASTSGFSRSATSIATFDKSNKGPLAEGLDAKPIAKLFVICCKCKFWHDLPSKLYEAMALPQQLNNNERRSTDGKPAAIGKGRLETAVKCPWCEHAMTTWCCAGWTTVVYLHERHH